MRRNPILDDNLLQVRTLNQTQDPQRLCWWAMHQDYCEEYVAREHPPEEEEAGHLVVKHLLKGNRGHYGPLEHPQITLAVGFFPHSVMQQARTHRVGVSFDVQSMRYTGERILALAHWGCSSPDLVEAEEVFFVRPSGEYTDRKGKRYTWTKQDRVELLAACVDAARLYANLVNHKGLAEEHARAVLPFEFRQHFVVSFNLRSALHFMDLRSKADAQDEIRALCELIWPHLVSWAPQVCEWYEANRLHKAQLSP
ncbi:MAG: FAD-dependent thymidylate synthase [Synechococcus sp.]